MRHVSIVKGSIDTGSIVRGRIVIVVAGTSLALGGCFTTSTDYQQDAEDFILTDDDLATSLGTAEDPLGFDSATCEKPVNQDAGTAFPCTAIDENGAVWEFSAEIGDGGTYEVNVSRDPRTQRD
jgi:hypothetical protein